MNVDTETFSKPLNDLCFKYVFSHEIVLKDGDIIKVNADMGEINILSK